MTDKRTDEQLSRAVAEKKGEQYEVLSNNSIASSKANVVRAKSYATDWQLIGPEIEKRWDDDGFWSAMDHFRYQMESPQRAACLAILEE